MKSIFQFLLRSPAPGASSSPLAIRFAAGTVFVTSGAVKFLFENQGPLRFAKIGLAPWLAYAVGAVEIAAGLCLLCGLFTRMAAIPLMIDMVVAIVTTKLPFLTGVGAEPVSSPPKTGLWAFAYQARLDVTMLFCCGYLVAVGAGLWSLDAWLARRRSEHKLLERLHTSQA